MFSRTPHNSLLKKIRIPEFWLGYPFLVAILSKENFYKSFFTKFYSESIIIKVSDKGENRI